MSYLALTNDELALLRFTCDLFFVEESPLFALDAEAKEPADYASAYHGLVQRGIIDAHGFRVTDDSLNRIAPVTECDARVVHTIQRGEAIERTDHWLLDEISVSYSVVGGRHLFGEDLDQAELVESLARHLVPRRAKGDRLDIHVSPLEFLALSALLQAVKQSQARTLSVLELKQLFKDPPPKDQRPAQTLLPPGRRGLAKGRSGALVDAPAWDDALRALVHKGALRVLAAQVSLHPSLHDLATRDVGEQHSGEQHSGEQHSVVRTDFGEGDWFVRECTFIPVEGSLFFMGPRSVGGRTGLAIEELDGDRLRLALIEAVGPLPREKGALAPQKLVDLLMRSEPIKA